MVRLWEVWKIAICLHELITGYYEHNVYLCEMLVDCDHILQQRM